MGITEQIRVLCVRCNISNAELARRLNVSPQAFSGKMKRESFTISDLEEIAEAQYQIYSSESSCAEQHQRPASEFFYREYGHEGEDEVCDAGDDYVYEGIVHVISCSLEDFLSIVEYDIRSAPLLEYSCYDA